MKIILDEYGRELVVLTNGETYYKSDWDEMGRQNAALCKCATQFKTTRLQLPE